MEPLDRSLRELTSYRLHRTAVAVLSEFNAVFASFGLRRTTFSALALIVDRPGLRQGQLADALAIERPNIVHIVDELEAAGLVKRLPATGDRRAYALQPTPMGRQQFLDAMSAVRERDVRLTNDLTPEQIDALLTALTALQQNATSTEAENACQVSRA